MSVHTGKIGRLPEVIREKLNQRLADGEAGEALMAWLNALPEVKQVLAAHFGGEPIKQQNLSNWHTGGFLRWQQQSERRAAFRELVEDSRDLDAKTGPADYSDTINKHFSRVFAADFAVSARQVLNTVTDPVERCERIQGILETLRNLRREEYREEQIKMGRDRQEHELEMEQWEEERRRDREREVERIFGVSLPGARPAPGQKPGGAGGSKPGAGGPKFNKPKQGK